MIHRCLLVRAAAVICLLSIVAAVTIPVWADNDEMVAFNTKTLKYHCLKCQWAVKCTQNCITIKKSEAIKRGGVPCKVCGGSCQKSIARSGVIDDRDAGRAAGLSW